MKVEETPSDPSSSQNAQLPLDDTDLEEVEEIARIAVQSGFFTSQGLIENLTRMILDEIEPRPSRENPIPPGKEGYHLLAQSKAIEIVEKHVHKQLEEQDSWTESETDFDRLEHAFDDLEDQAVIARMNFECCRTCADAAIGGEDLEKDPRVGFVYFHQQDLEQAVDGEGLAIRYGSFEDYKQLEVGGIAARVLSAHGFAVDPPTDPRVAMEVPMVWKRRLEVPV